MANELAKMMKNKRDAELRLQNQNQKPVVIENTDGSYYAPEQSEYTAQLAQGKNITITTSGNIKTIAAVMNLLEGSNISVLAPDENGAVTISATIGGKEIDLTGLDDGYVLTYDLASDKFIVSEVSGSYTLQQATEIVLGGIKAKVKTTEVSEVAIDGATGKLYAPAPDAAANGLPQGGTAGQVLSKIDGTDYNAQWVNAPSGGSVETYCLFDSGDTVSSRTESGVTDYIQALTSLNVIGGYFHTDWISGYTYTFKLWNNTKTLLASASITGDGSLNAYKLIPLSTPYPLDLLGLYYMSIEVSTGSIKKYYGDTKPTAFILKKQSSSGLPNGTLTQAANSYSTGLKIQL